MPKLDLRALGELGLIEAVRRRAGPAQRPWVRGIGDDGAVLRPRPGRDVVVTTDALVEDVHFRWSTSDARSLGRKTLAVNLSDLNAMGSRPLGFVLSLGLPANTEPARLDDFVRGLLLEARHGACPLVGGDTVRAPCWTLSVTALGDVPSGAALRRDKARPGDRLFVTGALGGSALGLHLLEAGATDAGARRFLRRHQRPTPPYAAGPALVRTRLGRAALDLSDGLALDLPRLCRESGVGADVSLEGLPLAPGLRQRAAAEGLDPLALALSGGEDYELLFCVGRDAPDAERLTRRIGTRVHEIGVIRAGRDVRWLRDGEPVAAPARGFEHFKPLR